MIDWRHIRCAANSMSQRTKSPATDARALEYNPSEIPTTELSTSTSLPVVFFSANSSYTFLLHYHLISTKIVQKRQVLPASFICPKLLRLHKLRRLFIFDQDLRHWPPPSLEQEGILFEKTPPIFSTTVFLLRGTCSLYPTSSAKSRPQPSKKTVRLPESTLN